MWFPIIKEMGNSLTLGQCDYYFENILDLEDIFVIDSMRIATGSSFEICSAWQVVNTGSGNGLVPDGTEPLPDPVLTQIYLATMS